MCVVSVLLFFLCFFFNDTATTEIYTLSLHDALPISGSAVSTDAGSSHTSMRATRLCARSEEHTSELQSCPHLVCRLLLEKKKKNIKRFSFTHKTSIPPTRRHSAYST